VAKQGVVLKNKPYAAIARMQAANIMAIET
jgi:hypothetical protein